MALEISSLLVRTLFGLYLLAVVLRFLLRLSKADYYNPITQEIIRWTQPTAGPLSRVLPVIGNIDTGTLCTAILLNIVATLILFVLSQQPLDLDILRLVLWACIGVAYMIADIYFFLVLAVIVMSWVAPFQQHPVLNLVRQLSEPVMAPMRRLIPPIGGLDLSPILLFLAISVVELFLKNWALELQLPKALVLGI